MLLHRTQHRTLLLLSARPATKSLTPILSTMNDTKAGLWRSSLASVDAAVALRFSFFVEL